MARTHIATAAQPQGTAFPAAPATGARFYRSDRNVEYFYDGTRWLSTQLFVANFASTDSVLPHSANAIQRLRNPEWNRYSIYIERATMSFYQVSADSAANYFTCQIVSKGGAATTDIGTAMSTQNEAVGEWDSVELTINTVVAATQQHFDANMTEFGVQTIYATPGISYRLVG